MCSGIPVVVVRGRLLWLAGVVRRRFSRWPLHWDLPIILFTRTRDRCRSCADQCFRVYRWTSLPKKTPRQEEDNDDDCGPKRYWYRQQNIRHAGVSRRRPFLV